TDYLTKGFLAKRMSEEIKAPGISAQILQSTRDITKKILKAGKNIKDPLKREKAINQAIKKITDKIEKGKEDISAQVASMFNGKQYVLYVFKRYDDVRVVFMPPAAIGNYGGEIDNWMWPRHTGDFAFMRVYMSPEGEGRKYHKDNIPLKAKTWLKVSKEGLKKGDFTFCMGYPGTTTRYRTSNSVDYNLNFSYPNNIQTFSEVIDLLEKIGKKDRKIQIKVSGLIKGLANALKNMKGKVEGMKRTNFLKEKEQFEKELMDYLKKDPKLFAKYGKILDKIKGAYAPLNKSRLYDSAFGSMFNTLSGISGQLVGVIKERQKPKKDKNPFFSEKAVQRGLSMLHYRYMSYDEGADRALLKYALHKINELPEGQRIKSLEYIMKKGIDTFVDLAYDKTKLKDPKFVKKLYTHTEKQLRALKDPLIEMSFKLYPEQEKLGKKNDQFGAVIGSLRKQYIDALYAWKGTNLYPDANRSIRLTYGDVAGYSPKDAVNYSAFTTLKGVIEKDTGKKPFNVPEKLKKIYKKRDLGRWISSELNDVPVAFTHKIDTTGGSSGSPVLNARGEMVGIVFDGNYESMNGDWQYDNKIQRTISWTFVLSCLLPKNLPAAITF
ncbi:MAG: V8-like Glu-specific endopeptidase, partial [Candidatus Methanomarinus sp.]